MPENIPEIPPKNSRQLFKNIGKMSKKSMKEFLQNVARDICKMTEKCWFIDGKMSENQTYLIVLVFSIQIN